MVKGENLLEKALKRFNEIVEDAKNLVGFSERDGQILGERKEILKSWADDLVGRFYSNLLKYPKTAQVFEKVPVEKVKSKFKTWYEELVSGKIDEKFLKRQFFVGLVHIYYHIDNDIMIFSANNLKRDFLAKCFEHFEPDEAVYVFQAFSKLVDFVIALTVEGYEFALYEGLTDIAGFKPELVERMMEIKLKEMYETFKKGEFF
jgi:hypothetical protein